MFLKVFFGGSHGGMYGCCWGRLGFCKGFTGLDIVFMAACMICSIIPLGSLVYIYSLVYEPQNSARNIASTRPHHTCRSQVTYTAFLNWGHCEVEIRISRCGMNEDHHQFEVPRWVGGASHQDFLYCNSRARLDTKHPRLYSNIPFITQKFRF